MLDTHVIAATGSLVAHACHLLSVLVLYQLTLSLSSSVTTKRSSAFAFMSANLHIISPAGLFLSAPYAESSFALVNFTGFYLYSQSFQSHKLDKALLSNCLLLLSGITFGVASMLRGNGLFSGVVYVYDAIEIMWTAVWKIQTFETGFELVSIFQRLIIIGFTGVLMACIACVPQYIAYSELCLKVSSNLGKRKWCDATVPSVYAWVQKEYW